MSPASCNRSCSRTDTWASSRVVSSGIRTTSYSCPAPSLPPAPTPATPWRCGVARTPLVSQSRRSLGGQQKRWTVNDHGSRVNTRKRHARTRLLITSANVAPPPVALSGAGALVTASTPRRSSQPLRNWPRDESVVIIVGVGGPFFVGAVARVPSPDINDGERRKQSGHPALLRDQP